MPEHAQRPRVSERLGFPPLRGQCGGRSFFAAIVIGSFGIGLYLPISLLYFTEVSGVALSTVGWCLSAAALVMLPTPLVIGHLVDRFRARPMVVIGQLLEALAFLGYLLVDGPWLLFVTALLARGGERLFWSSVFTLVADLSPRDVRDRWYALVGASRSVGIGLGTLVVAILLAAGEVAFYQLVVGSTGVLFLLAAAVIAFRVPDGEHRDTELTGQGPTRERSEPVSFWRDGPFLAYAGVNTCFAVAVMFLGIGLPVYVKNGLDQPGWMVGVLSTVNIALIAVTQTWVNDRVRHVRRTRLVAAAGLLWAVWGVGMATALALPGWLVFGYLVVAVLAFSAAELLHGPASNTLASEASPPEARGRYLSVFQLAFALAGVVTPTLFAQAFELGPAVPWLVLAAVTLLAGGGMLLLERHLPQRAIRLETDD